MKICKVILSFDIKTKFLFDIMQQRTINRRNKWHRVTMIRRPVTKEDI